MPPVLFRELALAYYEARAASLPKASADNLWYKLFSVILDHLGELDAYRITPQRLDQYVAKRLKAGVKRTTIHRELCDIQAILNFAAGPARRLIRHNPVAGYEKPKRDDAVILPPTQAEAKKILAHAPAHLVRALALSYYTGLRPGKQELFSLAWSQVDWDLRVITVLSAKKGGLPYRMVPIHRELLPSLRKWYDEDGKKDGPVVHYRGKPIATIKTSFGKAKKEAGITRKLPPYAFRHAFATYVLGEGGDLKSTSEILGHSRPDTTTRIYHHTNLTLHRKAVDKLPPLNIPPKPQHPVERTPSSPPTSFPE